jgi:hypothetical protein
MTTPSTEAGALAAAQAAVTAAQTSLAAAQATAAAVASLPPIVATPPPSPPPVTPVPYSGLAGTGFAAKAAAAGAQLVALPAGTLIFNDFAEGNAYGAYLPSCKGLIGEGADATIIEMVAGTSTKTSPTTGTNGFSLLRFDTDDLLLSDFTLQGTPQKNLYNGLRLQGIADGVLRRLKIAAIPGNDHQPPGETFGINAYLCSGLTLDTVEVDGAGVGASGIATNSYQGDLTATDCSAHDLKYSAGAALWQHSGGATFTRFSTQRNLTGASLERCTGTFTFADCIFAGNTAQDFFLGNDQSADCHLLITDPIVTGKLKIAVHATEQGKPNLLTKANVKVLVDGADQTANLVEWV